MTELFINTCLGMGDAIICNGLVRHFAREYDRVYFPAYKHNLVSVTYMFSDEPRIHIIPVTTPENVNWHEKYYQNVLRLGFAGQDFDREHFDRSFYEQARVPFETKWSGFKYPVRKEEKNDSAPLHAFIHDDPIRELKIDRGHVHPMLVQYTPHGSENIFDYLPWIQNAQEIHCIDSCFLSLADLVPTKANKLFLHKSARNTHPPQLKKDWIVI